MTTFRYQAYDTNEKKISGSINAENKLEVIENLKNLNLVPIKIIETKAKISQLKISQAQKIDFLQINWNYLWSIHFHLLVPEI